MRATKKNTLAVLIATADREDMLECRAFPSIKNQSYSPSRVIVVDDSSNSQATERTERLVRQLAPTNANLTFLHNRRTKGASGAWNSGLDHLLRMCDNPERLYVAILDDDAWDSHHLERCLATVERRDLDMVATRFWQIEKNIEPLLVVPPSSLDISSFLLRNPGIQVSNLVCRLSVLLEAGLFDEALPSCTERDLCIRIAELPGLRYGTISEPTFRHFACAVQPQLSTQGSHAKNEGLDQFFRKYRGRMSVAEREKFRTQSKRLFGWRESAIPSAVVKSKRGDYGSLPSASPQLPLHLIVGVIADAVGFKKVGHLLADLRELCEDPGLSDLDVLILENGCGQTANQALRDVVESERLNGLRIHLVDRAQHREDAAKGMVPDAGTRRGHKLSIAHARTVLQSYLYAFAKNRHGSVVWIVDDDMRLDPLVIEEDGHLHRQAQELVPMLQKLRRYGVDIAIGTCTGAPPVPFAATVRVQLVDLVASLSWLASQDPRGHLPNRGMENAELRFGRRDYYYDLSRNETDRLETPFWITPAFCGESVGEAFERVASTAEGILAGEQIFRPLAVKADINPLDAIGEGLQRGGNTFVFDVEALKLAPNPSLIIDGRSSRRSDMVWALLQKHYFRKRVVTVPIALYHDRSRASTGELDIERIVDDIRGYAIFSALQDTPGAFTITDDLGIDLVDGMIERFVNRIHKYAEDRLAAFRLSFYRICGLTRVLYRLVNDENAWWQREEYRTSRARMRRFCDFLRHSYEAGNLARIEREASVWNALQIRELLEQLPAEIDRHRNRLLKFSASASFAQSSDSPSKMAQHL